MRVLLATCVIAAMTVPAMAKDGIPPGPGTPAAIEYGSWLWGQGDYDGDRDAYRVTIPAGQLFGIATGGYGCIGGGSLKLFDAGFHLLKTTPAPPTTYAWLQWRALYTGDYYVQVSSRYAAECAGTGYPGVYWVSVSPDCAGNPTTTCGLASVDGMIWSEKDRDWLIWDVSIAGTYHVEAQRPEDQSYPFGGGLSVRAEDTSVLADSNDTPPENCSTYGSPCVNVALVPGRYFVAVRAGLGGAGFPYEINAYIPE